MKKYIFVFLIGLYWMSLNLSAQDKTSNFVMMDQLEDDSLYNSLPKIDTVNLPFLSNVFNIRQIDSKSMNSVVILTTPTPKSQGNQGSCSAWAVSYAAGGVLAYSKYNNWNEAERSPAYLFNQYKTLNSHGTYSCSLLTLLTHQQSEGVCSWNQMPYDENDCMTQPTATQHFDAYLNRINYYTISSGLRTSTIFLKSILNNGYPIPFDFQITDTFRAVWNSTGVWTHYGTPEESKYHAMCIVGYDDNIQCFKVQNSWGTNGGDNGYVWMSYSLVQNGVIRYAYVLSSITQDTYPSITGPTKLCSSEQYLVGAIPSGMTVTWGVVGLMRPPYPITYQSDGNSAIYTRGTNIAGNPYIGSKTIKATISNGTATYVAKKTIVMPQTVEPSIDYQNHATFTIWMKNQTRTLQAFNTNGASPSNLLWAVQMPQSSVINYYTGEAVTLTPNKSGSMVVTLTNEEGCTPNNSCTNTYSITGSISLVLKQGSDSEIICYVKYEDDSEKNIERDVLYDGDYVIDIRNEQMQLIYSEVRSESVTRINKDLLSPGLYSIRLIISDSIIDSKILVVK